MPSSPGRFIAAAMKKEVIDKLLDQRAIERIIAGQFESQFSHFLAEQAHPRRTVGLLQIAARRQRGAAIENAYVIQPQKPTLEHILAETVLAVDPPGEVQHQLGEH